MGLHLSNASNVQFLELSMSTFSEHSEGTYNSVLMPQWFTSVGSLAELSSSSELKSPDKFGRQPKPSKKSLFMTPPVMESKSSRVDPSAFAQPRVGGKYSRLRRELCLVSRLGSERVCVVTVMKLTTVLSL